MGTIPKKRIRITVSLEPTIYAEAQEERFEPIRVEAWVDLDGPLVDGPADNREDMIRNIIESKVEKLTQVAVELGTYGRVLNGTID